MRIQFVILLLLLSLGVVAQPVQAPLTWETWSSPSVPSSGKRVLIPAKSTVYAINESTLRAKLLSIANGREHAIQLSLPDPRGRLLNFMVWGESMMETPLAANYPEIRTYNGYLKENPGVTVKLDHTPFGMHAMVFSEGGVFFIDPYSDVADGFYNSYFRQDYPIPAGQGMVCGLATDGAEPAEILTTSGRGVKLRTNGSEKKVFRLALACTGEYAAAVAGPSPTKPAVLSKMVTTMNRVNGVYERELGITMTLIGNNDTLVFLDGTTDPYANGNGGTMLGQNQSTVTARIGAANYDIGHVFSTGGGGIAASGCVCKDNAKARGVTGSNNPVGDPFDIDYVAHEMGHQFDADHTFNTNLSSCAGNGVSSTAYEPGSGATIMSYAGICGVDNLQAHSDAYFHSISLVQITNYLQSAAVLTCPMTTASGNTPPVVPPFSQTYAIPKLTPFELTAPPVMDTDHDTLTYSWEQWNRGNFNTTWSAPSTKGPIFRSFMPDTSGTRVFPRIGKVVAGVTTYLGEKLPDVDRFLTFRLTVRDIYNGVGSHNFPDDSVHLDVVAATGPFLVLSPAVPVNWLGNTVETVNWDVAGTDQAPVNCSEVDIYLSTDGGLTYPYLLVSNTPNDGQETVTVPNVASTNQARIKVKAVNNVFFNVSPVDFIVTHNTGIRQVGWQAELRVFPVPAREVLHVVSENNMKLLVRLTNTVGQVVYEQPLYKGLDIPVAELGGGVYYLQIINTVSGERIVKPVIVD